MQQTNHSDIAAMHQQNTTSQNSATGNGNISSVLSQIQDDGPAYINSHINSNVNSNTNSHVNSHTDSSVHSHSTAPAPQRPDNLINLKSDQADKTSSEQTNKVLNSENKQPDLSVASLSRDRQPLSHSGARRQESGAKIKVRGIAAAAIGLNKTKFTWIQLSLISFVVLIVFILLRIDARTNQLEVTLNSLDAEVLDTVDSYTSELSPKFRSIKNTLKAVRQDIELIKASTVPETAQGKLPVTEISDQSVSGQPVINNNVGSMEDEILALKNELKIVKDKLKNTSDNIVVSNRANGINPHINEQVTVTVTATTAITETTTTGWVANLASFTTKAKANKAIEPLYAAGLSPMIQQANVNGHRIYRLIVDGFASKADAKTFVRRADNEFGLPGGWIRKS